MLVLLVIVQLDVQSSGQAAVCSVANLLTVQKLDV